MLLLVTVLASGTEKAKVSGLRKASAWCCLLNQAEQHCHSSAGLVLMLRFERERWGVSATSHQHLKKTKPNLRGRERKEKKDGKQAKKKQKNKHKQKTHARNKAFGPLIKTALINASILRSALFEKAASFLTNKELLCGFFPKLKFSFLE